MKKTLLFVMGSVLCASLVMAQAPATSTTGTKATTSKTAKEQDQGGRKDHRDSGKDDCGKDGEGNGQHRKDCDSENGAAKTTAKTTAQHGKDRCNNGGSEDSLRQ